MKSIDRRTSADSIDVMVLQTAASLENVASGFYTAAAALPCVKAGDPAIAAFIAKTAAHHAAHARAFNQAAGRAGGRAQTAADPRYATVVRQAWPSMTSTAAVISLALTLEDAAAQSFVKFAGLVAAPATRLLFGSVAPVEAQHRAALLAMQALLDQGANTLISADTSSAALPGTLASAALPAAFYPSANASAVNEGAVR